MDIKTLTKKQLLGCIATLQCAKDNREGGPGWRQ